MKNYNFIDSSQHGRGSRSNEFWETSDFVMINTQTVRCVNSRIFLLGQAAYRSTSALSVSGFERGFLWYGESAHRKLRRETHRSFASAGNFGVSVYTRCCTCCRRCRTRARRVRSTRDTRTPLCRHLICKRHRSCTRTLYKGSCRLRKHRVAFAPSVKTRVHASAPGKREIHDRKSSVLKNQKKNVPETTTPWG